MRGSPITAFLSMLLALVTLVALTGCVTAATPEETLRQNLERLDLVLDAAVLEVPEIAVYVEPARTLITDAMSDGELNENDLRPLLIAAKEFYLAAIRDDTDIGDEEQARRARRVEIVERFVRTFLPPADQTTAPTAFIRRTEASPATMPGLG